jgi:Predicted periplasmic or secreted lipoprotein
MGMGSRYGNQDYQRRGRGYGRSEYGSEPGREHFGGSSFRGDDHEENYFGSARQDYGEGYGGRTYSDDTYSRDFERGYGDSGTSKRSSYNNPDQRFGSANQSERGFGDDWHWRNRGGYSGQSNYGRSQGRGQYGSSYPESESGFRGERRGDGERGWWDRASDEVSSWFGDDDAERRRQMDERREGSHRGKGPKNYTRSDERIKEDINDRLTDYAYIDASDIDVQVNSGEVILGGEVDSRYDKRLAEDIAEDVSGVKNVENRIRVNRDYSTTSDWSDNDTLKAENRGSTTRGTSTSGMTGSSRSKTAGS